MRRYPCVATWLRRGAPKLGKQHESCDKVNEGLVSRAVIVQRHQRVGQLSLPKLENWLSVHLGFPKI